MAGDAGWVLPELLIVSLVHDDGLHLPRPHSPPHSQDSLRTVLLHNTTPFQAEAPRLPGDNHPFQPRQPHLISQVASGVQWSTSKALAWTMRAQEACRPIKRSRLRGLLSAGGAGEDTGCWRAASLGTPHRLVFLGVITIKHRD